jgi:hypothetical protein
VIAALARPPLARLLRTPRSLLTLGAWCLLAVGFAIAARASGSSHGADHALVGAYGALVLPLLAHALVGAVVGSSSSNARSLAASTAPLVSFGASPARAAAVAVGVAVVACAALGAVLAAAVALLAHGADDPPAAADALASAYAGLLGGAAYAAWFAAGASFGRRGTGRTVLLVVDWLLGAGHGAVALVTPRAHLRNLLGGDAPMGLSGRASTAVLVALAVVCAALAVRRARSAWR